MTEENILSVLDSKLRFFIAKLSCCVFLIRAVASLSRHEVLEKWKAGRKEHGDDFDNIDGWKEMRDEAKDAFWYSRFIKHGKH